MADLSEQIAAVRNGVGVWPRVDWTFVRFAGPDAAGWLQTQTCNDVLALASGEGQANALLDRKAYLLAHFTLHRWRDEYWAIIEREQVDGFIEQLDAHLFLEKVEMADVGGDVDMVMVQGPRSFALLASLTEPESLPPAPYACRPVELLGHQALAFRLSDTGEDGFLLAPQAGDGQSLIAGLLERGARFGIETIDADARETLRIEAGIPRYGVDMDDTNRIPETTLERVAVSYDKGCYLGQEVVAKLKAYSSVKRALMGLVSDGAFPPPNTELHLDGKPVGVLKSSAWSPTLERHVALAYLDRDYRAPDTIRNFGEFSARIVVLPFVTTPTPEERAHALYDEALTLFEDDLHDEDDHAIELLQESVLLAPAFEDAYEALGVILNRHHRVDEAIAVMKRLEKLNPDSHMVHTNLSVFYVAKGMIQEAEAEKAKAAVLQMKATQRETEAEVLAAQERERIRQEAVDRIAMFKEVLEIDPDDPLATFGMGMAHVQLDEQAEAIPYFERATQVQKDYSVAYLNLGKCLEATGDAARAAEVYRTGIETANRKGDLMPMREMERRLKVLDVAPR